MVFISKSIDVISPVDGKRYTSLRDYERSLESKGQYIMEDKTYRQLKEKLNDEIHSAPQKKEELNHVHIDIANGRIVTSKRDLDA